ncbi:hypothetical protein KR032_001226 [Drosophila birchii]|nr:hypothetical protein KR032_001226 [Drosophila birchii]
MENCDSEVTQFRLADLQLAAELGKSLLERNKELDTQMNAYKSKAEEQEREIIHLRKLINIMGEENDSRLKVYEKLDAMLMDLERANERLNAEKIRDKRQIKILTENAEELEARCDELTQQLSLARQSLNKIDRYKQERNTNSPTPREQEIIFPEIQSIVLARHENVVLCHDNLALSLAEESFMKADDNNEDLIRLLGEMETIMRDYLTERRRCTDLEEQLEAIIKENKCLQDRLALARPGHNMMSVQEEFCLLNEVRQGQMCSRCLAKIDENHQHLDDQSSFALREEQDLHSMFTQTVIEDRLLDFQLNALENPNPYHDVVEKYEALLEVKRTPSSSRLLIDAKITSALNIPSVVQQQQQKEMDTKKSVVVLNMAPIEFWEAETCFSGKEVERNCSKIDISDFSSSAVSPPVPLKEESPEQVSAISQNLAIGDHVTNVGFSYFSTNSTPLKSMEEKVFVLKPLKRQVPENIPVAAGMRKKNRRKHHDNGALHQPQLQMGQCSVSDFGRGISCRRVTVPPTSLPVLSNHWKGSAKLIDNQTPIGPQNNGTSYAEVLRGANTSPSHLPTKFHGYIGQRSQQTNVQKRY